MKYIMIFSTVVAVVGVILVSGSLYMVPYTVREQVRVDKSKTWVDDTLVLMPLGNRTYSLDSVIKNTSIFQVDVESSDFIFFRIISDDTGELWLERRGRGTWASFWTPPKLGYDVWRFGFYNPSSMSVNVTAKVREFYFKITEYQDVTYYRSLLDSIYGYSGIIALIVAIGLNVIQVSRQPKK